MSQTEGRHKGIPVPIDAPCNDDYDQIDINQIDTNQIDGNQFGGDCIDYSCVINID